MGEGLRGYPKGPIVGSLDVNVQHKHTESKALFELVHAPLVPLSLCLISLPPLPITLL